jgi:hypothetical protein
MVDFLVYAIFLDMIYSVAVGDGEAGEKPVDPIRIFSDKDLIKEIEKVVGLLAPEQDWSVRIAAMQRIEGLLAGGEVSLSHLVLDSCT